MPTRHLLQNCAPHSNYLGFRKDGPSGMKIGWRWGLGDVAERRGKHQRTCHQVCLRRSGGCFWVRLGCPRSPHVPLMPDRRRADNDINSISSTQYFDLLPPGHRHDVHAMGFIGQKVQLLTQDASDPPLPSSWKPISGQSGVTYFESRGEMCMSFQRGRSCPPPACRTALPDDGKGLVAFARTRLPKDTA